MARGVRGGHGGTGRARSLRRRLAALLADESFIRAMSAVGGICLPPGTAVVVSDHEFEEIERWLASKAPSCEPDGIRDVRE